MADPLSISASVVALLQLSATVVKYISDVKNAPDDLKRLMFEVSCIKGLLSTLQDLVQPGEAWLVTVQSLNAPNGPLEQTRSLLERLVKKLAPGVGLNKARKALAWPFQKGEVRDTLSVIERQKTLFLLALQNDHLTLSQAIKYDAREAVKGVTELLGIQEGKKTCFYFCSLAQMSNNKLVALADGNVERSLDQERRAIVDWLSPLNFFTKQNDIFSSHQEGTGQWLLESGEFQDWVSGIGTTLWCPGIPGAGKTVLASIVVDQLRKQFQNEDGVGVACIYCNYKERDTQTLASLVASLWRQLVLDRSSLSKDVKDLYKSHIDRGTRPTLSEISKALQSEISRFSKVFVVVDALDECLEDQSRASLVTELRALQPTVNLMVTSRFLDTIACKFEGASQLEVSAATEDIRTYVAGRISREGRLSRHVQKDATLGEAILKTVVGNAKKMFLLAQLHMDSLARKGTRRAVRDALKTLPNELDGTYHEAMQRIRCQVEYDRELAERVLSWISYALRPLTLKELQHALAIDPSESELDEENLPDEELLASVCAGLVIIDRESNVIRLVHYTTQEYFERTRVDWFPDAQTSIATTCLTYVSFDAFAEGCCCSNEEMEIRLRKYPLLGYAAQHWGDHAGEGSEKAIGTQALKFLECSSKLMCSYQVVDLHRYSRYHLCFPKNISGLHIATSFGLTEIVRLLLENGTDVNVEKEVGGESWMRIYTRRTALHLAADKGHEAVTQLLLENGANTNAEEEEEDKNGIFGRTRKRIGRTALHLAAEKGYEEVTRLLLENGANADAEEEGDEIDFFRGIRKWIGRTALHLAAEEGHEGVTRLLLENGANANAEEEEYEGGALGRTKKRTGRTALHLAAEKGHEEVTRLLLENGANANAEEEWVENDSFGGMRKETGRTALHLAAEKGHEAVTRLLLENGANADAEEGDENDFLGGMRKWTGRTALHLAAENGHEEVTRLLLENGAKANAEEDVFGETRKRTRRTALHLAAEKGHEGVTRLLLENRANANAEEEEEDEEDEEEEEEGDENNVFGRMRKRTGRTALHLAAENGHEEVTRLLLENGANANAEEEEDRGSVFGRARKRTGRTALHLAAEKGHEEVTRLLLENGANANAEKEEEIWGGVFGKVRKRTGRTALHLAAEKGHEEVTRLLLENGANANAEEEEKDEEEGDAFRATRRRTGRTALHLAAGRGHEGVTRLLLENGANANAEEEEEEGNVFGRTRKRTGRTALHLAAENGHEGVTRLLLENGANANAEQEEEKEKKEDGAFGSMRKRTRRTALHLAAENGHEAVTRLLIPFLPNPNQLPIPPYLRPSPLRSLSTP